MAEYLSIGPVDPNTAMWLRDAARQERLPAIKDLDNPKYFPYRWGQAFWAYVAGRWGDEVIGDMLTHRVAGRRFDEAFEQVLGVSVEAAVERLARRDSADAPAHRRRGREPPMRLGARDQGKGLGAELNVGPSISPDGRIAFLSTRSFFSIDLFIAEAATGSGRPQADEHGDRSALLEHAVHSLGGRVGQRQPAVAVATVTPGGRAALAIFDAQTGAWSARSKFRRSTRS